MSKDNEPKIVKPELSINKKLGNIKFDQAFDTSTISSAEREVAKSKPAFTAETSNDYNKLKSLFEKLTEAGLDKQAYEKISELAFSIKARAGTAGKPLASQIAESMYKFSDAAIPLLPEKGYTVLKLHIEALMQVFDQDFAANDPATSKKLIKGLEEVAHKFLHDHER